MKSITTGEMAFVRRLMFNTRQLPFPAERFPATMYQSRNRILRDIPTCTADAAI